MNLVAARWRAVALAGALLALTVTGIAVWAGGSSGDERSVRSAATSTVPTSTVPTTTVATATVPTTTVADTTAPTTVAMPVHRGIVSTTFWVGEVFDPGAADGSQVCSTYDAQWALRWSGISTGRVPDDAEGCPGAPTGGCDGITDGGTCSTERRSAANGFFPTRVTPLENPFYLDVPYDDVNNDIGFARRCEVIPWARRLPERCTDRSFSFLKNHWVRLIGPNGATCYGQIQDAGPGQYHDAAYVFGADDARPVNERYGGAGMDVSPALNGCLGFAELDGESDRLDWQFVEDAEVPPGPWSRLITTSGVNE